MVRQPYAVSERSGDGGHSGPNRSSGRRLNRQQEFRLQNLTQPRRSIDVLVPGTTAATAALPEFTVDRRELDAREIRPVAVRATAIVGAGRSATAFKS